MSDITPIIIDKDEMKTVKISLLEMADGKNYLIVLWENGVKGMLILTDDQKEFFKDEIK